MKKQFFVFLIFTQTWTFSSHAGVPVSRVEYQKSCVRMLTLPYNRVCSIQEKEMKKAKSLSRIKYNLARKKMIKCHSRFLSRCTQLMHKSRLSHSFRSGIRRTENTCEKMAGRSLPRLEMNPLICTAEIAALRKAKRDLKMAKSDQERKKLTDKVDVLSFDTVDCQEAFKTKCMYLLSRNTRRVR